MPQLKWSARDIEGNVQSLAETNQIDAEEESIAIDVYICNAPYHTNWIQMRRQSNGNQIHFLMSVLYPEIKNDIFFGKRNDKNFILRKTTIKKIGGKTQ